MQVRVNDQEVELPERCTVLKLLEHLALPSTRVAVEVNREIVRRAEHPVRALCPGDQVEVVTLVGGG